MSKKIVKRLNGRFLLVEVDKKKEDENSNLTTTDGGIIIEKKEQVISHPYVLATVNVVGDELKEKYNEGDRVMLISAYRGEPLPYNNFKGVRIPEGVVIAVI